MFSEEGLTVATCELYAVDLEAANFNLAFALLSEEEKGRAAAFHFERDRRRWVAARGALRRLMATTLGIDAQAVEFGREFGGRPFLNGHEGEVDFNLSHSDGMALIGICRRGRVGVDIECRTRGREIVGMREMFCSKEELSRKLTPEDLIEIWCAKEAYLKARGTGLNDTLETLTAGPEMGEWRIYFPEGLETAGYCAAVALPVGVECPSIEWF